MSQALILLSIYPEDRVFAQAVATCAGLRLMDAPNVSAFIGMLKAEPDSFALIDARTPDSYASFEATFHSELGLFSDHANPNQFHFIGYPELPDSVHVLKSPLFGSYITCEYGDPTLAGTRYGLLVKAIASKQVFGLAGLMKPGTKIQKIPFTSSAQKQPGVEVVKNYLLTAKFTSRMALVIANAVDELLMNAMFDAPIDALSKPLYATTPRNTVLDLKGKQAVELQVGFDGESVGITAIDLFGSLDKGRLVAHIQKRYSEEEYVVRTHSAGAGIGLANVFKSGGSFFFSTESKSRTEVTVFFTRTKNFVKFKSQFRFLATHFQL